MKIVSYDFLDHDTTNFGLWIRYGRRSSLVLGISGFGTKAPELIMRTGGHCLVVASPISGISEKGNFGEHAKRGATINMVSMRISLDAISNTIHHNNYPQSHTSRQAPKQRCLLPKESLPIRSCVRKSRKVRDPKLFYNDVTHRSETDALLQMS